MFEYDWPQLHAALNDLPAALLLVSVVADFAGVATKRETLHTVGFWTLIIGVIGGAAAAGAGLLAARAVEHSDAAHLVMERHQAFGLTVLALFSALAAWRLVRRETWRPTERSLALALGIGGVVLLIYTSHLGGRLVFEHALGIPSATMEEVLDGRHGEAHEHDGAGPASLPGDTGRVPTDSMHVEGGAIPDSTEAMHDHTSHPHSETEIP